MQRKLRLSLALLLLATPAAAQQVAGLRPYALVDEPVVRLSDLFEGAGPRAELVLGPAPAPGQRLVVEAPQLMAIARMNGLAWQPSGMADRVVIERPGRTLSLEEVQALLREALQSQGVEPDSEIELHAFASPLVPAGTGTQLGLEQAVLDPATQRFAATLAVLSEGTPAMRLRVTGRVVEMTEVLVASRRLAAGEVLRAADVRVRRVPAGRMRPGAAVRPEQAIGQALRRPAAAEQPLLVADLAAPMTVERGANVVMLYEIPGMSLTAQGRAMESGARGAIVSVMNLSSRVVVEAQVVAPGRVRVGSPPMRPILLLALPLLLGACERLSEVGRPPAMAPLESPTASPHWRQVSMPMPAPQEPITGTASLWRPGSRTFLRDQRAAAVGDIVTILVSISDEAQLENRTERERNGSDSFGMPRLLGLESSLTRLLPNTIDPSALVSTSGGQTSNGNGTVQRSETVTLRVATTVAQVLPNGNLVVAGRQQVRVNAELRDLQVSGIIRPQDIASDNTVRHDRLAEARIAYGGRGTLSDLQQPRIGQQILDIILPF